MFKRIASPQLYSWWGGQQDFLSMCNIPGFFQNLSAFLGYFFLATNMHGRWLRRRALVLIKLKVISLW